MGRESPKVSGLVREYSRFAVTFGGDGFDHNCLPTMALCLCQFSRPDCTENGNLSLGLPRDPGTLSQPVLRSQPTEIRSLSPKLPPDRTRSSNPP